jgi:hypothetical protein
MNRAYDVIPVLRVLDPGGQSLNHAHGPWNRPALAQSCGHERFKKVQVLGVVSPQHPPAALSSQPEGQSEVSITTATEADNRTAIL